MNVFERDNFTCQLCNSRGVYLEAHHIKFWANYPELRFNLNNGVTLCRPCHMEYHKGSRSKK
jgi:5-methylcytosine-specific restriction endonuclease McrA